MVADNSGIFTGITALHCIFNTPGNTDRNEFCDWGSGTIDESITLTDALGGTLWTGPITMQWNLEDLIHERMHIIGTISGSPSGFDGFPDRGFDRSPGGGHHNFTWDYDIISHNGTLSNQYSLYGLRPISTHDLIFLGWIKSDEIQEIRNTDLSGVKLADVNYSLTSQQKANGFYRTAKVMLHENYIGDLDEYLLIEFHNATEFDKNFTNYDEPSGDRYNKGILVWHIKETVNLLDWFSDNMIDLEPAVPYNGYYSNPVPNDSYPRNYTRSSNYNGILSGDYDYLDDLNMIWYSPTSRYVFEYLPDGGRHVWETTTSGPYGWYPSDPNWFYRPISMKSDFFTDATVKGRVNNVLNAITRPSTKDWAGNQTNIAVTNIQRVSDYMTFDIRHNAVSGTVAQNTTISGNIVVTGNLIIPSGVTLTISPSTTLQFDSGVTLVVNGTLNAVGNSSSRITFTNTSGALGMEFNLILVQVITFSIVILIMLR
ncbi:hypothetical protein [Rosettibacter firmus]|uniref:hypothetical protein n=1 Tax=Rosettibacter firmus TaxID=3111522 RepID=UPI00336C3024